MVNSISKKHILAMIQDATPNSVKTSDIMIMHILNSPTSGGTTDKYFLLPDKRKG